MQTKLPDDIDFRFIDQETVKIIGTTVTSRLRFIMGLLTKSWSW